MTDARIRKGKLEHRVDRLEAEVRIEALDPEFESRRGGCDYIQFLLIGGRHRDRKLFDKLMTEAPAWIAFAKQLRQVLETKPDGDPDATAANLEAVVAIETELVAELEAEILIDTVPDDTESEAADPEAPPVQPEGVIRTTTDLQLVKPVKQEVRKPPPGTPVIQHKPIVIPDI